METIGAEIVDHNQQRPTGIDGWLLIFVVLATLMTATSTYSIISPSCFPDMTGFICPDPVSIAYQAVFTILVAADIALILSRKRLARALSVIACGWAIIYFSIDAVWEIARGWKEFLTIVSFEETALLTCLLIFWLLWLLYFLRSRRVRNTLTQPLTKPRTA